MAPLPAARTCRFGGALAVALAAAFAVAGCAPERLVEIDSRPADAKGASIYVNGEKRGVTPAKVRIRFGPSPESRVLVQVVKPNYKPAFQYWTLVEAPEKRVFDLEDE
ncbi:MAG: PEGA domain-containing protein [Thermoanaerobaculia bacterium]